MIDTFATLPNAHRWYVIHCKHLHERRAALALHDLLGLETYYPEVRRRAHGKLQRRPFFPGYLFALADLCDVAISHINATPGVLRLITFGDQPQPMPVTALDAIRERVNAINIHGGMLPHPYHPGDTVRIKCGPLHGIEAIFTGPMKPSERVRVLIDFLGHQREAQLSIDDLEPAHAAAEHTGQRRTRGRGRPINRPTSG